MAVYLQLLETINAAPHPSRARRRPDENFRWFAWQPKRLSYVEVVILLVGTLLFNVGTALALVGGPTKEGISWLLLVLSLLGAGLFTAGAYLMLPEMFLE